MCVLKNHIIRIELRSIDIVSNLQTGESQQITCLIANIFLVAIFFEYDLTSIQTQQVYRNVDRIINK